jgi:hypothetical protein
MAVLAAALALIPAGIAVASSLGHLFAHGQDRGPNPVASAYGETQKPHVIYAKITTIPSDQTVGAKYSTNCAKGKRGGSRGNKFAGRTPLTKKLRLRFSDPDVCDVSLLAAMKADGTLKVELYAKRR